MAVIATIQEMPTENPAKRFTYEQHYVPSPWLQARNLAPGTCERYGVGQYDNPSRQSAYRGRVLIRMQRFSDGQVVGISRETSAPTRRGATPRSTSCRKLSTSRWRCSARGS